MLKPILVLMYDTKVISYSMAFKLAVADSAENLIIAGTRM